MDQVIRTNEYTAVQLTDLIQTYFLTHWLVLLQKIVDAVRSGRFHRRPTLLHLLGTRASTSPRLGDCGTLLRSSASARTALAEQHKKDELRLCWWHCVLIKQSFPLYLLVERLLCSRKNQYNLSFEIHTSNFAIQITIPRDLVLIGAIC